MFHILTWPFSLVGNLIGGILRLVGGLVSGVFSLVGGLVSFVVGLFGSVLGLMLGMLFLAILLIGVFAVLRRLFWHP